MVDSTIRIIVDPSGAVRGTRVVNRALDRTATRAKATASSIQFLQRAIGLLGIGLAVRQIVNYADSFTQLQNRIRVTGRETDDLASATERLVAISQRTRTSLEGNVALFQRLGIAQEQLGATNEELFIFVEAVGNALAIQGAAAGTARGAVLQLSQAVGSGVVRAEEFNSILEGAFPVALAAARGMERFGGSVAKLRAAILAGEVSSKEFFQGILSQGEALQTQFAKTTPTISQAFTVLNDGLLIFIGQADTAEGLSSSFARAILKLATNLDTAAAAVGTLTAALAPAILLKIASGLRTVAISIAAIVAAAGPLGVIATVLSAATGAVFFFGDSIEPVEGSLVSLKDIAIATFNLIFEKATMITDFIRGTFSNVVIAFAVVFNNSFGFIGKGITTIFNNIKTFANGVINTFRAIIEGASTALKALEAISSGDFEGAGQAYEGLGARIEKIFGEDIVTVAIQSGKDIIDGIGAAILAEAESVRASRAGPAGPPRPSTDTSGGVGGVRDGPDFTNKQATALRNLRDSLDPVGAAFNEVAKAQLLLSQALVAGKISKEESIDLNMRLTEAFKDQLNPLAAVNRELEQERELLLLSSGAREVATELRDIENDLKAAGIKLDEDQRDSLRNTILELNNLSKAIETQERIFRDIRGAQEDYGTSLAALDQLLMDGRITFEEFDEAARGLKLTLLDENEDLASGFERGLLRATENFNDFASQAEASVTKAFQGMEDALADFVKTGKLDFSSLANSIIDDLVRITIRQNIVGPLANLLSGKKGNAGIFGGASGGGGTAGGGGLFSGIGDFFGGLFQSGGSFTVPGTGGSDSRLVSLRATPGETISVSTPGEGSTTGGRPIVVNASFNFPGGDESSIRANRTQVAADAQQALQDGFRRNG